ncbi:MAG: glutamate racemase [Bacteroidales bacterium]|nr:glutamate racemase [Candidatus Equibacterium intestinale]
MIGIFDSGIGGLSVWQKVFELLPEEDYVYFADSRYCPYGLKTDDFIAGRAQRIAQFLADKGADVIIVACNTATAAAIDTLRNGFSIPFVGMEPAIKPAILETKTGVVGVLATAVTFTGRLYHNTLAQYTAGEDIEVIEQVGYGLVEAVEQGKVDAPETVELLHSYIDPMLEAGADHIVLGCTHYPFLTAEIEKIVAGRASVVNPAGAVARQAAKLYHPVRKGSGRLEFYSSGTFTAGAGNLIGSVCKGHTYCLNSNIIL